MNKTDPLLNASCILLALMFCILAFVLAKKHLHKNIDKNFLLIADEYVGGQHFQIIEDETTHVRTKLVNDQVVSETNQENYGNN